MSSDSRRVPRDQLDSVVKALYDAAHRIDWGYLPPSARTTQYDEWVKDAEIGGVLTQYMSSENARSWIKDGPMKEYGRACLGAGRYAKFGGSPSATPEQLVTHALGARASVITNSYGVKPFHCLAIADGVTTYVSWESPKNLRHLVWASINYLADHPQDTACIILMETMERPIPQADKVRHSRIAGRCAIKITYYQAAHRRPLDGEKL
ncbi:hypothetical protein [Mycolicibacterium fluoranthenivorans]|uniref:Uncharacterized protein n=1 Tax=Mycolicibacterium fluoranthenivorans TaxID=258505 RepID=A0A7X5U6E3_9MYCO|nr:hypothetical protein [Mycolicibacterium fluoranthenivorans]MCV7356367.1 hypothetical protein [Mycolicibacterium fluoranthenivorans]NIH97709.1 hypothetical protein [Mycolicibacterium fluoranthenivorans]NIH99249.1 hypothetical protein [Mycolicibacterium fluoranthenivorans]